MGREVTRERRKIQPTGASLRLLLWTMGSVPLGRPGKGAECLLPGCEKDGLFTYQCLSLLTGGLPPDIKTPSHTWSTLISSGRP